MLLVASLSDQMSDAGDSWNCSHTSGAAQLRVVSSLDRHVTQYQADRMAMGKRVPLMLHSGQPICRARPKSESLTTCAKLQHINSFHT